MLTSHVRESEGQNGGTFPSLNGHYYLQPAVALLLVFALCFSQAACSILTSQDRPKPKVMPELYLVPNPEMYVQTKAGVRGCPLLWEIFGNLLCWPTGSVVVCKDTHTLLHALK